MDVVTNLGANLLKFAEIYVVRGFFFAEGQTGGRLFDGHEKGSSMMKMGD